MIKSLNNFQQRFLLGFLGILLVATILFFSHQGPLQYLFLACVAAVQAASLSEYYLIAKAKGARPSSFLGVFFSCCYIFWHFFFPASQSLLLLLLAIAFIAHFPRHSQAIINLATTLFGFCYITLPLSYLVDLNFTAAATCLWIVYLIVTTKVTDTFAYFAGKTIGKHFLAPRLSPKKTIEGAIGGLIGATASSLLFFSCFRANYMITFSWVEISLLGVAIGSVAQIGDLAESLLKRDANVKDSSCMPGFGGMLDIVDSLLFTTPLLYFWLQIKGIV